MSDRASALLEAYVKSDASPAGKWWTDVPVGLSLEETESYPLLDAVCLTSRPFELPECYPGHTGMKYAEPTEDAAVGITKADRLQTLRDSAQFADERAVLVAVEPGVSSVDAIGRLQATRVLLEADWSWTIEELLLLSDVDRPLVNHVCRELDIRAVRVAT